MAMPPTPVRTNLDLILDDGDWHDREAIVAELVHHIPPGRAIRTAINTRAGKRRRDSGNPGPADPNLSRAGDDQAVGVRHLVMKTIHTALRRGTTEQRTVDGHIQIRKTPPKGTPT